MKLSDYVLQFLEEKGTEHIFFVPGGGCMHLADSLQQNRTIEPINLLHEQSVAIATESYAFTKGCTGVALLTTGPGGTNAVTGVLSAYLDSIPCLFLSGQVKTADLKQQYGVRSHGSQEADIVEIVQSITKYSFMVRDKNSIRYHLEKAWYEANHQRKGPVWLDIPLDIQGSDIDPDRLYGFTPAAKAPYDFGAQAQQIISMIQASKRPLLLAGNGLRGREADFYRLLEKLNIPIIPSWKAVDLVDAEHPLYVGKCGTMGERAANFAVQSADLLISLGCKLDYSITGYERDKWAVHAKKVVIDIDENELHKLQTKIDLPLVGDVGDLMRALLKIESPLPTFSNWMDKINHWKAKYPIDVPKNAKGEQNRQAISTYQLVFDIFKHASCSALVVPASAGTVAEICHQAMRLKKGQMVRSNHGLGSMGYELPSAIGAHYAKGQEIIVIAGDGGMQLNIQELSIIAGRKLPIKIFVVNNEGYASIRNMQINHFNARFLANDENSGLFLPKMALLAKAYGIESCTVSDPSALSGLVQEILGKKSAFLCDVSVDPFCVVSPKTASKVLPNGNIVSTSLEDMFPFLPEDELKRELDLSKLK